MSKTIGLKTIPQMLQSLLNESILLQSPLSPFRATMTVGDPRLTLLVGDNASGKSLLFRVLAQESKAEEGYLPVTVSIRERTESGMRRAFMYGDEVTSSTGTLSAQVVRSGFGQKYTRPWLLLLDEPEMGLSEGYSEALGELIGKLSLEENPHRAGTLVITHSRRLAEGLNRGFGGIPFSFVAMQAEPLTFSEWMADRQSRTVAELEGLGELAHKRRRAFTKLTDKESR